MGLVEDHLHGFWFPDEHHNRIFGDYGIYHEGFEDDPYPWFKTKDIPVSQIDWKRFPVIGFVFDFGDGHKFDITFKTMREKEKGDAKLHFPYLVDQRGVAPEQYPPDEDAYENDDKNISGSMEDFLYDDCAICQVQKEAVVNGKTLTREKLTKAFEKATGKGKAKNYERT